MARMKSYAVEVEVTIRRTLYVEARKPGGAETQLYTDEGWQQAMRHADPSTADVLPSRAPKKDSPDFRITNTREL